MPVKKIKKDEVPPKTRFRSHPLKELEEWTDVQAILADGLKRAEAVEISLDPRAIEKLGMKLGNATRNFKNLIRTKVKELNLKVDVWQQGGKNGTSIYIVGQ